MNNWTAKYTQKQREALYNAYFTAGIHNRAQIGRLARSGELTFEGHAIEAFDIPDASVREIIEREKKRRTGRKPSTLAAKPPQDAVETLRQRLCSVLDNETIRLDEHQRKHRKEPVDAEQLRKLGRAVRELAAIPGPGEHTTRAAPGRGQGPIPEERAKPGSIGGDLMKALTPPGIATQPETARTDAHTQTEHGETTTVDAAPQRPSTTTDDKAQHDPGSWARGQLSSFRAERVSTAQV